MAPWLGPSSCRSCVPQRPGAPSHRSGSAVRTIDGDTAAVDARESAAALATPVPRPTFEIDTSSTRRPHPRPGRWLCFGPQRRAAGLSSRMHHPPARPGSAARLHTATASEGPAGGEDEAGDRVLRGNRLIWEDAPWPDDAGMTGGVRRAGWRFREKDDDRNDEDSSDGHAGVRRCDGGHGLGGLERDRVCRGRRSRAMARLSRGRGRPECASLGTT